jgi:hypothetical protein
LILPRLQVPRQHNIDWCIFARFCAKRGLEALLAMDGTRCGSLAHEAAKGCNASTLDLHGTT